MSAGSLSHEKLITTDMNYLNDVQQSDDITSAMQNLPDTKEANISAEHIPCLISDINSQLESQSQASQITDMTLLNAKVENVIREVEEKSNAIMRKWSVCLAEGELFEDACIQRLDQLIQEAQDLEQSVFKQKENLLQRAAYLTSHLGKFDN